MNQIQALIEKARRYLRSAELLIHDGDYDSAVSRSYYAMFYSAEAALLKKEMTFSSHKAVISAFGQYFVKTGIFDKRMGRDLNIIFGERQLGDYESNFSISEDNARHVLQTAQGFVDRIAAWLETN
ncbi:MAG TPA: HEPN domain-containing protein [Phycisphaerales bacterium]|nr:HEPN domain-containing protein [Phycisphaerales bacterium]